MAADKICSSCGKRLVGKGNTFFKCPRCGEYEIGSSAPAAVSTRSEGATSAATRVFPTNARNADSSDREVLRWDRSLQLTT